MFKVETPDSHALSNIVSKNQLRAVQQWTLNKLAESLLPSAGPFGSTTQILKINPDSVGKGGNPVMETTEYTKDGHTILSHIRFNRAIEDSLQKELADVTRHIVKTVGDGTTSVVILSALIFNELLKIDTSDYPPYLIIEVFQEIVEDLKKMIKENGRDLALEDVYNIAMICTNSNKRVAEILSKIYEEHGLDVFIDVGASTGENDVIKTYDGLTIDVGFSDPCYINKVETGNKFIVSDRDIDKVHGETIIRNPHVYAFKDPIDTIEMHNLFNSIIYTNIIKHYEEFRKTNDVSKLDNMVPTVVLAPKISTDMGSMIDNIAGFMHNFDNDLNMKPPLLIVTNISQVNYETYSDIWRLCGCTPIKKYIDPEIQKKDIEDGVAPTPDTIADFFGTADEVKSDSLKTTFINPHDMFKYDADGNAVKDENGERTLSETYTGQLSFLEQELQRSINDGEDINVTGNLKRRIHALKANMVDYYVGGVTVTDRDSVRALTEDAVKNIRSAAKSGVGYGANYEGFKVASEYAQKDFDDTAIGKLKVSLSTAISNAYNEMEKILYSSAYIDCKGEEREAFIDNAINDSLNKGCPVNLKNFEFDHKVLCTIEQDIIILDCISKIITVIFTTNQALTQSVGHNMYIDMEKDL